MHKVSEMRIQLPNGFEFAAKAWGDPQAEPILAMHGWLDNAGSFDLLAPLLTRRFYVLAIDLPGHGWSNYGSLYQSWSIVNSLALIYQIPRVLGWESYRLLGHSLGACLSCLLASVDPKVRRAFFIDGYLPVVKEGTEFLQDFLVALDKVGAHPQGTSKAQTYRDCVQKLAKVRGLPEHFGALLAPRAVRQTATGWQVANARSFRHLPNQYLAPAQLDAFLEALTCPCQLILAESGIPEYTAYMESKNDDIAQLEVCYMDGGHYLHLESPKDIASRVTAFFRD